MEASRKSVEAAEYKGTLSPVVASLTRLGYGARGLIYGTMGLLAFQVAVGSRERMADQQGAIAAIGRQPAGLILLVAVLVGIVCYALWGVFRAVDGHHKHHGFKEALERLGYLFSAAAHASLVLPTYDLITGGSHPAQGGTQAFVTQHAVATVLSLPWGNGLVCAAGVVVLGVGAYQIHQGIRTTLNPQIRTSALTSRQVEWIVGVGRFGTVARGVLFAIIGGFIVFSAYRSDASQARGIDGALRALLNEPYGPWLLALVATGLLAFGLYSLMNAFLFRFKE